MWRSSRRVVRPTSAKQSINPVRKGVDGDWGLKCGCENKDTKLLVGKPLQVR